MDTLRDVISAVEHRKAELGVADTPTAIEALRNKGARRTPQKREILRRADERARAAGLDPVPAYY